VAGLQPHRPGPPAGIHRAARPGPRRRLSPTAAAVRPGPREYYTPRPLIRAIVQVVRPRIDDRIYDGACGSAGFFCESEAAFFGKEKKSLAYVIGIMNMILHGIDAPTTCSKREPDRTSYRGPPSEKR
jgi:hypothetical protein